MRNFIRDEMSAWALIIAITATCIGITALKLAETRPPKLDTSAFVRKSQISMGVAAANVAANTRIREALRAYGVTDGKIVLLKTTINGDTALVEAEVTSSNGVQDVTVIEHRTLWQVDQITNGLPAAAKG